ncbi:MAG: hypothetical protein E7559_05155, partial [Ruminococcaceae bacterium]|nr:hypothetical protein [Oscillospiraceae bacterium]
MAKKKKELKRIKGKKFFNYKRRRGDRTDGWRVHASDPTFDLIPHIMPMRCDSQVFFEEELNTSALDEFVRRVRRDPSYEMPELSRLAVVMAACVRAFSRYPRINRFVAGNKIYARNHFSISLTIKQSMSIDSDEANLKLFFDPDYNLRQVYDVIKEQIDASKNHVDNATDNFVDNLTSVPQFLIRAVVNWVNRRDRHRGTPKWLHNLSPFHTSMYITDIGSTGIGSVYHHIYNLGTTSVFISIGRRDKKLIMDENGDIKNIN